MAESEAGAAPEAEQPKPRRGRPPRALAENPPRAAEPTGEEIQQVRFVISVRWLDTERTSLDVASADVKRFNPRIVWHPRGVQLEADGQPTLVIPQNNLAWVRLK